VVFVVGLALGAIAGSVIIVRKTAAAWADRPLFYNSFRPHDRKFVPVWASLPNEVEDDGHTTAWVDYEYNMVVVVAQCDFFSYINYVDRGGPRDQAQFRQQSGRTVTLSATSDALLVVDETGAVWQHALQPGESMMVFAEIRAASDSDERLLEWVGRRFPGVLPTTRPSEPGTGQTTQPTTEPANED
jgi:hypothetical protein